MSEMLNIAVDREDLEEFKSKTGMNVSDCIKILINSVKYGGKLELDKFWSEQNIDELKNRMKNGKFIKHDLIEVD